MTCTCTPMSTCAECAEKMMSELPPLPEPGERFVFAGLDWHRATPNYFDQMRGQTQCLPLFTADQMRAYAAAAVAKERERWTNPREIIIGSTLYRVQFLDGEDCEITFVKPLP